MTASSTVVSQAQFDGAFGGSTKKTQIVAGWGIEAT